MSGTAAAILCKFLKRISGGYEEISTSIVPTSLSYTTDMRTFSGAFDFELELSGNESLPIKGHDAVEFYVMANGSPFQIGVGFIEDLVDDSSAESTSFKGSGRDLLGQLLEIPYKKNAHFDGHTLRAFTLFSMRGTYIDDYLRFRSRSPEIVQLNPYAGTLLCATDSLIKRGDVVQEYAEKALNLIYQDRLGRVMIYGRTPHTNPAGVLTRAIGKTNVDHISRRQSFSKVHSEAIVLWESAQKDVDLPNVSKSNLFKNTDPRASALYQPLLKVFSATDLTYLAGQQDAQTRISQMAKSEIRRSNQYLNSVTVVTSEPFFRDPVSGSQVPFDKGQDWHIIDSDKGLDVVMRLAGISYSQSPDSLEVQLSFIEPDTLI